MILAPISKLCWYTDVLDLHNWRRVAIRDQLAWVEASGVYSKVYTIAGSDEKGMPSLVLTDSPRRLTAEEREYTQHFLSHFR